MYRLLVNKKSALSPKYFLCSICVQQQNSNNPTRSAMTRIILFFAAIVISIPATANDGCKSCGVATTSGHISEPKAWGFKAHKYDRFTGWFHNTTSTRPPIAPWYLYFPYNGQFQTPSPVGGSFPYGNVMINPYFPGR